VGGRARYGVLRTGVGAVVALGVVVGALVVAPSSAVAATTGAPTCPPDCGAVAAGDPLLVPSVMVNPGPGWLALPSSSVEGYVGTLRKNLTRTDRGRLANVAAAKWTWLTGRFQLLVVLASSPSLGSLHLGRPAQNAADLCAAAHGRPSSQLVPVAGVPGSVSGLCRFAPGKAFEGATVTSFTRGDVAVLMEISAKGPQPIDARTAAIAAQQQFATLPAGGVLVSGDGADVPLLAVWFAVLGVAAVAVCLSVRRRGIRAAAAAAAGAIGRRRWALGVALLGVVGTMAFSMLDSSLLHGTGQWYEAGYNDFWRSWTTAAKLTYGGGYGHVYSLDSALETAPTWLVLIAPVARLASGLSFPDPSAVLYPSAFWVAGPLFLSALALPMCAADRCMASMGALDTRRRLAVLGTMAVTLPPIALFGHSEDLVALGAALYGLLAAREGRAAAAGWWLGVGLAFQFLSFLAVPMALVLLARSRWPGTVGRMVAVPAALLAVPVVAAPSVTLHQLVHQTVYEDLGYITPTWRLDPGVGGIVRALVAVAAVPAALVVAKILPRRGPGAVAVMVWTLGLLFALRVVEPELVPYFLAPALALLSLAAVRRSWWRLGATCAGAVWLTWWLHDPVEGRWWAWLVLVAQLGMLAAVAFPGRVPAASEAQQAPPRRSAGPPTTARRRAPARAGTSAL